MSFVICGSSAVVVFFIVGMLVIVSGQPTTDEDIDNDEIAQLRAELADLKRQLTALSNKNCQNCDGSECNILINQRRHHQLFKSSFTLTATVSTTM